LNTTLFKVLQEVKEQAKVRKSTKSGHLKKLKKWVKSGIARATAIYLLFL
jgi:hypothetical protein